VADGPSVYTKDGIIYVRASSFGGCSRKLWAIYDGVQPMEHKDVIKRAFSEGHLHEAAAVEQLTQEGYEFNGDQAEVVLKILPGKLHIVGHIDGYINLGTSDQFDSGEYGGERLWECKSASRSSFDQWINGRFNARPSYAWQLAIYMLASEHLTAHYTVKRRDDGLIDTWLINEPPKTLRQIRSRAVRLYNMFKKGEMPKCDVDGGASYFCEFWFLHDEDEVDDTEVGDGEIPIDNIAELDDMLAGYYEVVETEKWAKKEKDRIKKQLDGGYRNNRLRFGSDHFQVKITEVSSQRLDKTALIAGEGKELVDRYTKTSNYDRWSITPRKEKG